MDLMKVRNANRFPSWKIWRGGRSLPKTRLRCTAPFLPPSNSFRCYYKRFSVSRANLMNVDSGFEISSVLREPPIRTAGAPSDEPRRLILFRRSLQIQARIRIARTDELVRLRILSIIVIWIDFGGLLTTGAT